MLLGLPANVVIVPEGSIRRTSFHADSATYTLPSGPTATPVGAMVAVAPAAPSPPWPTQPLPATEVSMPPARLIDRMVPITPSLISRDDPAIASQVGFCGTAVAGPAAGEPATALMSPVAALLGIAVSGRVTMLAASPTAAAAPISRRRPPPVPSMEPPQTRTCQPRCTVGCR